MADLGNVGRAFSGGKPWNFAGVDIALVARVNMPAPSPETYAGPSGYGVSRGASGVTIDIPTTAPGYVSLLLKGARVATDRPNAGHVYFYDLDDGTYYAHEVEGAGAWSVVVSGVSVTVTPLSSGGAATRAYGFVA